MLIVIKRNIEICKLKYQTRNVRRKMFISVTKKSSSCSSVKIPSQTKIQILKII